MHTLQQADRCCWQYFKKLLSAITTVAELTKHQISHVEPLILEDLEADQLPRKPFPGLEAIYMLDPHDDDAIDQIRRDFEKEVSTVE